MPEQDSSTKSGRLRPPASIAGWCRLRRFASICASAWPTAFQRVLAAAVARDRADRAEGVPRHVAGAGAVHHHLRLEGRQHGLDVHAVLRACSASPPRCGAAGWSASDRARPALSSALCWCGGLFLGAIGVYIASTLADVARLRRDRRHRPRSRLHLAGVDAGEMVSGPPRHGDRHGHHGLRRRRHDRRAAGQSPDELFQDPDLGRRLADLRRDGRHLLRRS